MTGSLRIQSHTPCIRISRLVRWVISGILTRNLASLADVAGRGVPRKVALNTAAPSWRRMMLEETLSGVSTNCRSYDPSTVKNGDT
jgi:hypothetical protein